MMAGFARAAWRQLAAPEWRSLAFTLFLLLAVTNGLMAMHIPRGEPASPAYTSAWAVQTIGMLSISVALLRAGAGSARKRWGVDAGFWLYFAIGLIPLLLTTALGFLLQGQAGTIGALFALQAVSLLSAAALSVWLVAAAVETPTATKPRFEGIGTWLLPLLILMLPLIVLGTVHAQLGLLLIGLAGTPAFFGFALADGIVSSLVVLGMLALQLAAYRKVARG